MSWQSYLYPQTVATFSSAYNPNIRVVEEWGKLKLLVNGSPQSGPYIAGLWNRVLPKQRIGSDFKRARLLVLGIGGGTVLSLLHALVPQADITAVDIDPTMLQIAKKYFRLDRLAGISLIEADAEIFVRNTGRDNERYDLVIVDLFTGRHIPDFVGGEEFLTAVRTILAPKGLCIINYLREREYAGKSDILLDKLRKLFHSVIEKKIFLNRFFICSK